MGFAHKTRAEQRLAWLESLGRPLTDEESDILRRSLHAVYVRERNSRILAEHRMEELKTLDRVLNEAGE